MTGTRKQGELNMVEARRALTRLPEQLTSEPATVTVTRRDKPVLAIMSWADYEATLETLAVLSDSEAIEQLRASIREVKGGKTIPWEDAKAAL